MALILGCLAFLLFDGWRTGSVWVKGARTGFWSATDWAHKKSRENEAANYWGFMVFYALGFVWLCYLIVRDW